VPIVLLNERFLEWSVVATGMLLSYLGWRCVSVVTGRATRRRPERWVVEALHPRALSLVAGGAALALVLLSIPGGLVSDVGFASLAGATKVLDGSLPYGNLPLGELVHGDTYPLLAYLAYVPAALASPVHDGFDGLEGALYVATAFALLGALALARLGGSRLAIAFVAFPPVMIAASSGSSDVVAAAFVAGALALGARAGGSTVALAVAGWVKLGPLALIPLWVARYRDRGVARAVTAAAAVTAVLAASVLALGGLGGFADMAHALSFQSERGSPMSIWGLLDLPAAQIAFQAAVLTGIAVATVRVWRDRALAADPRRMAALGAAVLLGVQLAANHWSATYLAWVFPLVAVALLADRSA
jgi:Glycosyltransferase family 87